MKYSKLEISKAAEALNAYLVEQQKWISEAAENNFDINEKKRYNQIAEINWRESLKRTKPDLYEGLQILERTRVKILKSCTRFPFMHFDVE